jgi:hypothetical protein
MNRLLVVLGLFCALPGSWAAEIEIDRKESIAAVVTQKAGFASRLAHNHLVVAGDHDMEMDFDPSTPAEVRFRFRTTSAKLIVDPPDLRRTWDRRLRELGILAEPFRDLTAVQRGKIRRAMLGKRQLDAESFPEIAATVVEVVERPSELPGFPYTVTLALQVRNRRVERQVAARFSRTGERITIEATGVFRFTEFGIEPYSAMLGAVRNKDEFHVYVNLTGIPVATPSDLPPPRAPSRTSGT